MLNARQRSKNGCPLAKRLCNASLLCFTSSRGPQNGQQSCLVRWRSRQRRRRRCWTGGPRSLRMHATPACMLPLPTLPARMPATYNCLFLQAARHCGATDFDRTAQHGIPMQHFTSTCSPAR